MSENIQVFVNKNDWFLGHQSNKYVFAIDRYIYLFFNFVTSNKNIEQ